MAPPALSARYERLLAGMQFVQLITRSFSTLQLTDHASITDTLSALIGSFFDCRARAAILRDPEGEGLRVSASEGFGDPEILLSPEATALWREAMVEKLPLTFSAEQLAARWPGAPTSTAHGLACVAIDLDDRSIGVLVVAGKLSRAPFDAEELAFLASASGLASMAVSNANTHAEQRAQRELAEQRSEQAKAEAREKQAALTELDHKLTLIAEQQAQIVALSTPILQVSPEVLAVPLIGTIDAQRREELSIRLMTEISKRGSRYVLLDITGVDTVDTCTADHFIRLARTSALLGARCVLTGVRPSVAQTLVSLDIGLGGLTTAASFGDGLDLCMNEVNASRDASRRG